MLSARRELARLGSALTEGLKIERAARTLAAGKLNELATRFADEASVQRRGFEDDRTLLQSDVSRLAEAIALRLDGFAKDAPERYLQALMDTSTRSSRAALVEDLRHTIEKAVEQSFDDYRHELLGWVEDEWRAIADRFRSRVQDRIDAARRQASELFAIPLPRLELPAIAEQRDQFSFLFLRVGSTTEPLTRALSRLVPGRLARRRALVRGRAELKREFDKHSGRARWDLSQRLDDARIELERAMRGELEGSIGAIVEAAERARRWQAQAQAERDHQDDLAARLQSLGSDLMSLAGVTV